MAVSIHQLSYTKLSRIIFEWQAADRASLLALFIVMEVSLHWLWCLFVWFNRETYSAYVNMSLLYSIWIGVTLLALFFLWMVGHLSRIKNDNNRLDNWQIVLIGIYTIYVGVEILIIGHSSLVSGVSLVGGAMLGMMLVRRRYIWRAFLLQIAMILAVNVVPYLGVALPSLREMTMIAHSHSYMTYNETITIENAIAASIFHNNTIALHEGHELHRASALFWRSTHMYLALPKAIFIVYVFRTLLLILDDSKEEILKHANQDELTKLNNRRYGLSQMQETLMQTKVAQDYSVILLDLDWFKNVNDTYGHEIGDKVLREVARILAGAFTETQIISRYGGEEFLIVLPDIDHHSAMTVAEQLRGDIALHSIEVDADTSFHMTASFGVYTLSYAELASIVETHAPSTPQSGSSQPPKASKFSKRQSAARQEHIMTAQLDQQKTVQLSVDICQRLISTADKALYKAKDRGRNQVVSANALLAEGVIDAPRYGSH